MSHNSKPSIPTPSVPNDSGSAQTLGGQDIAAVVATVRSLLSSGRKDDARRLLMRVVEHAPQYDQPWLQLLALDPSAREEVALLRGFLRHHPNHRFTQAFEARLKDIEIVALLEPEPIAVPMVAETVEPAPAAHEPQLRLGDYLIAQGWVTVEQVEHALSEQKRLERDGVPQRLGTILLRTGHLNQEQLAAALANGRTVGLGEFGAYFIRNKILTPEQVGQALARQAALMTAQERWYLRATQRLTGITARRKPVPRLGEIMVEMGMVTPQQVEDALKNRVIEYQSNFE